MKLLVAFCHHSAMIPVQQYGTHVCTALLRHVTLLSASSQLCSFTSSAHLLRHCDAGPPRHDLFVLKCRIVSGVRLVHVNVMEAMCQLRTCCQVKVAQHGCSWQTLSWTTE